MDTNTNLILEEFAKLLEARKQNAATKNVPTNSDKLEKNCETEMKHLSLIKAKNH